MIEIKEPAIIQRVEYEGEPKFKGKTTAKDMRNWIQGKINTCAKQHLDEEFFFREVLNAYNYYNPIRLENNLKLEIEILGGWKGTGDIRIYQGLDNDVMIKIPIKDKETGAVTWNTHEVKKEDINRMIYIVKKLEINRVYSCYKIVDFMGLDWKEDVWKNRTQVYFSMYYFPIKILEKLGMINYSGKGNITRLK